MFISDITGYNIILSISTILSSYVASSLAMTVAPFIFPFLELKIFDDVNLYFNFDNEKMKYLAFIADFSFYFFMSMIFMWKNLIKWKFIFLTILFAPVVIPSALFLEKEILKLFPPRNFGQGAWTMVPILFIGIFFRFLVKIYIMKSKTNTRSEDEIIQGIRSKCRKACFCSCIFLCNKIKKKKKRGSINYTQDEEVDIKESLNTLKEEDIKNIVVSLSKQEDGTNKIEEEEKIPVIMKYSEKIFGLTTKKKWDFVRFWIETFLLLFLHSFFVGLVGTGLAVGIMGILLGRWKFSLPVSYGTACFSNLIYLIVYYFTMLYKDWEIIDFNLVFVGINTSCSSIVGAFYACLLMFNMKKNSVVVFHNVSMMAVLILIFVYVLYSNIQNKELVPPPWNLLIKEK